jgi:hypothetical protein
MRLDATQIAAFTNGQAALGGSGVSIENTEVAEKSCSLPRVDGELKRRAVTIFLICFRLTATNRMVSKLESFLSACCWHEKSLPGGP